MRARAIVRASVGSKNPPQMFFVEDNNMVDTLVSGGPDQPLDMRILPSAPR